MGNFSSFRPSSVSDSSFGRDSEDTDEQDFMFNNEYSTSLRTAVDLDIGGSVNRSFLNTLTEELSNDAVQQNTDYLAITRSQVRANSENSDFDSIDIIPGLESTDILERSRLIDNAENETNNSSVLVGDSKVAPCDTKCNSSSTKMCSMNIKNGVQVGGYSLSEEVMSDCSKEGKCDEKCKISETENSKGPNTQPSIILPTCIDERPVIDGSIQHSKEMYMFAQDNADRADSSNSNTSEAKVSNNYLNTGDAELEAGKTNKSFAETSNLEAVDPEKRARNSSALSEAIQQESQEKQLNEMIENESLEKASKPNIFTNDDIDVNDGDSTQKIERVRLDSKSTENSLITKSERSYSGTHISPESSGFLSFRRSSAGDVTGSRKWKFLHPFRNLFQGEHSIGIKVEDIKYLSLVLPIRLV